MVANADELTPREREVLALMAKGKTNADISRELRISFPTAKAHVSSILAKLGVASREEAVRRWTTPPRPGGWARFGFAPLFLVALAAVISAAVVVAARTFFVESDNDSRPAEMRFPIDGLGTLLPRYEAVPSLGSSPYGNAYGIWLVRYENGTVVAFLDRDSHTGCAVAWNADYDLGQLVGNATVPKGAFKEPCGGWVYLVTGQVVFGAAPRGLDSFPAEVEGDTVVVDLTQLQLGLCRQRESLPECSTPVNTKLVRDIPPPMIPNWGHRTPAAPVPAVTP
ncbi:MAG: LuxR C-terminal-related transcriptional regulator [Tepidiformaceae bacterium]